MLGLCIYSVASDTGICWGNLSYWDYAGIRNFLSTILGVLGFSEIAAVATNLYTGWLLSEFESLLKFEEPSHISSDSSYLAYIARFEEISSGLLKLAEDVQ